MKRRAAAAVFLILSMGGTATIAYAATEAVKAGGDNSTLLAVAVIFQGFASIGGTGLLIKKYMNKVDEDGKAIPQLTATLAALEKAMATHTASIEQLFDSRNEHRDELTKINTMHELKQCAKGVAPAKN